MVMIKELALKIKLWIFNLQMERDDALTELEILKEKLDKALYSTQKTIEEKETAHKEYEKMLEKYDRYIILYVVLCWSQCS